MKSIDCQRRMPNTTVHEEVIDVHYRLHTVALLYYILSVSAIQSGGESCLVS